MRGSIFLLSSIQASFVLQARGKCPSTLPDGEKFTFRETKVQKNAVGKPATTIVEIDATVLTGNMLALRSALSTSTGGKVSVKEDFAVKTGYSVDPDSCVVSVSGSGLETIKVDRVDNKGRHLKVLRVGQYFATLAEAVGRKSPLEITGNTFGTYSPRENLIRLSDELSLQGTQAGKATGSDLKRNEVEKTDVRTETVCDGDVCYVRRVDGKKTIAADTKTDQSTKTVKHPIVTPIRKVDESSVSKPAAVLPTVGVPAIIPYKREPQPAAPTVRAKDVSPTKERTKVKQPSIPAIMPAVPAMEVVKRDISRAKYEASVKKPTSPGARFPSVEVVRRNWPEIAEEAKATFECPETLAGSHYDFTNIRSEGGVEITTNILLSVHPTKDTMTLRTHRHRAQGKSALTEEMVWDVGRYVISPRSCRVRFSVKVNEAMADIVQVNGDGKIKASNHNALEYLKYVLTGFGGSLDRQFGLIFSDGRVIALSSNVRLNRFDPTHRPAELALTKLVAKPLRSSTSVVEKMNAPAAAPVVVPTKPKVNCKTSLPANSEFRLTKQGHDSTHAMVLVIINLSVGSNPGVAELQTYHSYFDERTKISDRVRINHVAYAVDPHTCMLSFKGTEFDSIQLERSVARMSIGAPKPVSGRAYLNSLLKRFGSSGFAGRRVLGQVDGLSIRLSETLFMKKI